jgi:hypothetical protein
MNLAYICVLRIGKAHGFGRVVGARNRSPISLAAWLPDVPWGALLSDLEHVLRDSIVCQWATLRGLRLYPGHSGDEHEVCAAHIGLYVNDYSLDLGSDGKPR